MAETSYEEIVRNATPRPWKAVEMDHYGEFGTGFTHGIHSKNAREYDIEELGGLSWEDGQLIVLAVNSHEAAIAFLEALQVDDVADQHDLANLLRQMRGEKP